MKKLLITFFLLLTGISQVHAWPTKPITLIYPFPPGSELLARAITAQMQEDLGQPVIIDYRPGAGGAIAAGALAKAPPDGYTFLYAGGSSLSGIQFLMKSPPYDATKAFAPVAWIGDFGLILFVHQNTGIKNMAELITYAKANPGKLSMGIPHNSARISTAYLEKEKGIEFTKIPYKGDNAAYTDFISGRIDIMWATPQNWLPQTTKGPLRALVTSTTERHPSAPEVPSIKEAGLTPVSAQGYIGIVAPAGTPKDVVDRVNRSVMKARTRDDFKTGASLYFLTAAPDNTPEQFGNLIRTQIPKWKEAVDLAGISPE